ncbi:MAG TPA: Gfo/Idh/MocA family oxidoreductase [Gemmatimonadaceae bacterium]|nr:Gfo/Idh/MocA family oxidoreductase [Gemmatimonadaceae bacterium]
MGDTFRVGIVGLGNAAQSLHLPALKGIPNVTIVGGVDSDPQRRHDASARWRLTSYEDVSQLMTSASPDVVIVCTPPETHVTVGSAALELGAHLICEKPIAPSVAEAERLLDAARRSGRRIAMNHEFREMPAFRAVRDAIGADASGLVFAQAWQLMNLPPWAEPGWRGQLMKGVLYEAGIHLVDYLVALFGAQPRSVNATMSTCGVRDDDTDAVAVVTLEFPSGALGQIVQHRLCPGETQYFEVRADTRKASYRVSYGGRARVSAGLLRSTAPHVRFELGASGLAWRETGPKRTIIGRNPKDAPMVATRLLLERTFEAFRRGSPAPASGEDGRDAVRVVAASYVSAREGRRVDMAGHKEIERLTMVAS